MWVVGWITLHATLTYTTVNTFNVSLIEYRERIDGLSALQHLDSTDRASQSPRAAADLFTNKSQQQPAGRPRVLLFHRCLGSGGGGLGPVSGLCLCRKYMEVQMLADNAVSFSAAVFSAFFLSLWEFHCTLFRLQFWDWTSGILASPTSISLFFLHTPEITCLLCDVLQTVQVFQQGAKQHCGQLGQYTVFNLRPVFHYIWTLVHCYSKYALCVYTLFHLIGDGVWSLVILVQK